MNLITAVLLAILVAACGPEPPPPDAEVSVIPSAEAPDDATAIDLLECDGPPSEVGGAGEGIAAEGEGGATPDEAIAAFLATTPFVIPRSGYEPIDQVADRHAYGLRVDGEVKVVVVVSTRFADLVGSRFTADEVRTCPEPEFGPEADFFGERRVWAHIETDAILTDIEGPAHCEWQAARLLHRLHPDGSLDRQYVRDPLGVLARWPLHDTYAEGVDLPTDATDSGYRSPEGYELWFTEADTAAYVVTPDGTERWPRAVEPIGCA